MATRALILTHGSLGRSLLAAVEQTLGPQEAVEVLESHSLSLEHMMAALEQRLSGEPCVLFVDHCGGSPFIACKTFHDRHPETALITGVNLPMLLSFFTKRATLPFAVLVQTVEQDAHRGIRILT